jgi:putative ABC transport system ATP-binding protein
MISKFINNVSNTLSGQSGSSKAEKRNNADDIIIELKDVWKTYIMGEVKVHALRGLNLKVKNGEFLAVMGPSGSGKSTFMNMVGCLDIPSKGHIFLDGKDISLMSESDLAQIRGRKIGFIFQKFNLLTTMTARENVMLPLTFQGFSVEKREEISKKYLELVGLSERMNHTPNELSGGQQQRVAIARALANTPEVILADEPTGNLDSQSGKSVLEFLRKLHEEKHTTIIIVTHDEKIAKQADRLVYLKDGMVVDSLDVDTSKMKEFSEADVIAGTEKKKRKGVAQ